MITYYIYRYERWTVVWMRFIFSQTWQNFWFIKALLLYNLLFNLWICKVYFVFKFWKYFEELFLKFFNLGLWLKFMCIFTLMNYCCPWGPNLHRCLGVGMRLEFGKKFKILSKYPEIWVCELPEMNDRLFRLVIWEEVWFSHEYESF